MKFEKFVQLVATHDFEEVMKQHADDDIVFKQQSFDRSCERASRGRAKARSEAPIFLVVGVIIGVVITYLILRF